MTIPIVQVDAFTAQAFAGNPAAVGILPGLKRRTELGKDRFAARQLSARGGVLQLQIVGDRVRLGGQAVTVLRGELLV